MRLDAARLALEENSLAFELRRAKRLRDIVLLEKVYSQLDLLRRRRALRQEEYRLHRKTHSAEARAA